MITVKPQASEREKQNVEREVRIMRLLHHSNVAELIDVIELPGNRAPLGIILGTAKKTTCLVMELVTGGELFDYIVANGRVEEVEAIRFFRQIVSAIEYLHHNLVIHRDLKPENMLLDENLNIKITDFG